MLPHDKYTGQMFSDGELGTQS